MYVNLPNLDLKRLGLRWRLSLSVGLWLVAIGGLALWWQIQYHKAVLLQDEHDHITISANSLLSGLKVLMLAGDGLLIHKWLDFVNKIPGIDKVQILRASGEEAFRDLLVIDQVNQVLEQRRFQRAAIPPLRITDIPLSQLDLAFAKKRPIIGNFSTQHITYLWPIELDAQCSTCHDDTKNTTIGVLRLTNDLTTVYERINRSLYGMVIIDFILVFTVAVLTYLLTYIWVSIPIKRLIANVRRIASGDVDIAVTLSSNDEFGGLGMAMNEMADSLSRTTVSKNFVNSIMDSMLNALFVVNKDGKLYAVNPAACNLLGYRKNELLGQPLKKILAPNSQPENFCGGPDRTLEVHEVEQWLLHHNGNIIPILVSSGPILGMSGSRVCVAQNLSDYKRVEHSLRLSHQSLKEVVMKHHTGILVVNMTGKVLFSNHAAKELLGQNLKAIPNSVLEQAKTDKLAEIDITRSHKRRGTARVHMVEIDWENQSGYLIMLDDITERKLAEETMVHIAYHDALTGLPNRVLLFDRLTKALADGYENNSVVAVVFLNLDRFKTINDSLGHSIGDQLLQDVGARLQDSVRKDDTVARMSGDEFIILLTDIRRNIPIELIVRKILRCFSTPFYFMDNTLHVTASIGVSTFPDDSDDPEILLKYAATAMHHAKDQGRNQICIYISNLSDKITSRLQIEQQLRDALDQEQFCVYYQPQVDLENGALIGLEALLRWHKPNDGLVSIGPFVSVLEECDLINAVGAWVLDETCRQLREWLNRGLMVVQTSVNLSAAQLKSCDIITTVQNCLIAHKIPPELLGLELTESMVMTNMSEVLEILTIFAEQGIGLSIDDFGTGYSSLSVLRQLPVQVVKLDRSFVQDIPNNKQDMTLASAVIAMAHRLGKQVVAEGIETNEQHKFLRRKRCDYGQGYLFGRPMAHEEIGLLLQGGLAVEQ